MSDVSAISAAARRRYYNSYSKYDVSTAKKLPQTIKRGHGNM
jgi:hypothetical protein